MDLYKNPEKEQQDEHFEDRNTDPHDFPTEIAGPGGRTNNVENNERGILDTVIFRAMATTQKSPLGSNHDSYARGIYSDTDSKYAD
jgi:hypothetical protein